MQNLLNFLRLQVKHMLFKSRYIVKWFEFDKIKLIGFAVFINQSVLFLFVENDRELCECGRNFLIFFFL